MSVNLQVHKKDNYFVSKFHYIQEEVLEGVIVVDRCVATAVVN